MLRKRIISALLLSTTLALTGCFDNEAPSPTAPATPAPIVNAPDPLDLIDEMIKASEDVSSATYSFNMSLTGEVSESASAQARAVFDNETKITFSGGADQNDQNAQFDVSASALGQEFALGIVAVDGEAYVSLDDVWYEVPTENKELGISQEKLSDPSGQLEDLRPTIEEALILETVEGPVVDGQATWQINASINREGVEDLIVEDDPAAAQDENFDRDLDLLTEAVDGNLVIGQDDKLLRSFNFDVEIDDSEVIAEELTDEISSLGLNTNFEISAYNEPVEVERPTNVKSFKEFQDAVQQKVTAILLSGMSQTEGMPEGMPEGRLPEGMPQNMPEG